MDQICQNSCAFKFFTRFTYSEDTKSLHGKATDFQKVRLEYSFAFDMDQSRVNDEGTMSSFTILGRRAHAFICRQCFYIQLAKVAKSKLRKAKDYRFNHSCDIMEEEMNTQSSISQSSSFPMSQSSCFPMTQSSSFAMTQSDMEIPTTQSDMNSSQRDSELDHELSFPYSIGTGSIPAANRIESGYQTPELTLNETPTPLIQLHCPFKFSHQIDGMEMALHCCHLFDSELTLKDHKSKCPLRYQSTMNSSNPGYLAKLMWSFAKDLTICDYLANDINQDLINNVSLPGFIEESEKLVNVKKCRVFRLPKMCNYVIAHKEDSHTERKNKDVFEVSVETCQQMVGTSSSIRKFGRLSQTLKEFNIPRPTYLAEKIREKRNAILCLTETEVFEDMKRTNNSDKGLCYGSKLSKTSFEEFLHEFEEKNQNIINQTNALVVVADEGRGYLKATLVYSMQNFKLNAQNSIMLFIGELKESVESLAQIGSIIHLDIIQKRAADLGVPFLISGIFTKNSIIRLISSILGDVKTIRMMLNVGSGGHLKFPCYLCHIERKTITHNDYGVKTCINHTDFYDIDFCKSRKLRNVASYATNHFGSLSESLKNVFGSENLTNYVCPGSLHTLLGLNTLFDHISQHDRWIPSLYTRLAESKVSENEMMLLQQQKLIIIIFKDLVPHRIQDGLEKSWTGGQLKKVLAISDRLLDVFKNNFSHYKFAIDFLSLLVSFKLMYDSMFGKVLMPNWRENALNFLKLLREFLLPSCNIGLIHFHTIHHSIQICEKYGLGVGCMGLDQIIEDLHKVVNEDILPNVEQIRTFDVSHVFTKDDPAPESYIERFRSLHCRQLELSLQTLKLKPITLDHFDYLKTIEIDKPLIENYDKKAHEHGLLTKLSSAKLKKISKSTPNLSVCKNI